MAGRHTPTLVTAVALVARIHIHDAEHKPAMTPSVRDIKRQQQQDGWHSGSRVAGSTLTLPKPLSKTSCRKSLRIKPSTK